MEEPPDTRRLFYYLRSASLFFLKKLLTDLVYLLKKEFLGLFFGAKRPEKTHFYFKRFF